MLAAWDIFVIVVVVILRNISQSICVSFALKRNVPIKKCVQQVISAAVSYSSSWVHRLTGLITCNGKYITFLGEIGKKRREAAF